jgi:hypothetical protein
MWNQVLAEKVADVIHANSRTNNSARAAHARMAAELSWACTRAETFLADLVADRTIHTIAG